jgi:ABC-type polysaccharide/polyol phosphate transport system ATPase subunit
MLGARLELTFWHIEKLGINDLKKEKRSPEAVKKIFCAAAMAIEKDTIVFREFIRQETRDFERKFLALLKETMEMDRTIIYLGRDVPVIDSPIFTGGKNNLPGT